MIDAAVLPLGSTLIGGEHIAGDSLGRMAHVNPATNREQGSFGIGGAREVNDAVRAAQAAFPLWRDLPGERRRDLLNKLADCIEADATRLADIGVLDNGAPLSFTQRSCSAGPAAWFRYYAGWADKIEGRTMPIAPGSVLDYTVMQPYGVVALLLAFNGPMNFIGFKAAAALAAGNAIVIKPSELAPWNAIRFGELCNQAGIPPGVVNVVLGDGRTGAELAGHSGVAKISFTGGGSTARRILTAAAANLTPMTAELGGKSAAIIFADADFEPTIRGAVLPTLSLMSGQVCLAGTRLLVERAVYGKVVERAAEIARNVRLGDPSDKTTEMGPVINRHHQQRILNIIEEAQARGDGRKIVGGGRPVGDLAEGAYVEPTIFADVDPASALAQQEIFGPVLSIIPFDNESDAVNIANSTAFGLAGYIFTQNFGKAHRVAAELQSGFISINTFGLLNPAVPFGGMKQSGFGREGGAEGLLEMLQVKNVQARIS
jgi:aldehyde dehydrogenase (NAD+)